MNKKELATIQVDVLSKKYEEMVEKDHLFIVTAKLVCDNEILMLQFYKKEDLKQRKRFPYMRIFMSKDDYITEDFETGTSIWRVAALDRLNFRTYSYNYKEDKHKEVAIMSEEDEDIVKEFLDDIFSDNVWRTISRFQDNVRAKRLEKEHKKETDKIDAVMETVGPVPDGFYRWVADTAMSFSRYLIYKEVKKGIAECYCTHCKNTSMVNRKEVTLKNNIEGVCPSCNSKVTIKAKGKLPMFFTDERWTAFIEKNGDGFVWRYFHSFRDYMCKENNIHVTDRNKEIERVFYTKDLKRKAYDYRLYKDHTLRWCTEGTGWYNEINCSYHCLYPNNLPQAWEHVERMKYSALEILSENMPGAEINFEDAIAVLGYFPKLEWLIKMGLSNLTGRILTDSKHSYFRDKLPVNLGGKTIYDILKLSKENTRILQILNGDIAEIKVLQTMQKKGITLKPSQVEEYVHFFGSDISVLNRVGTITLHKLLKYLKTEALRCGNTLTNTGKDWVDYLKWCEALDYDISNMFYFMPKNLKAVHDRTCKEYSELINAVSKASAKEKERLLKVKLDKETRMLRAISGDDVFRSKGFIIIVPKGSKDLKKEGETLGHCVGTYVEHIAKGDTQVFFVRKEDEPDIPFYTLEWKDNDIRQCQGRSRRATTPEVEAFTQLFKKKMQSLQMAM